MTLTAMDCRADALSFTQEASALIGREEMTAENRSNFWTIPRGETTVFFPYFTTLNILGPCFVGWHERLTNQTQGTLNIIREATAAAGSVTGVQRASLPEHPSSRGG